MHSLGLGVTVCVCGWFGGSVTQRAAGNSRILCARARVLNVVGQSSLDSLTQMYVQRDTTENTVAVLVCWCAGVRVCARARL